MDDTTNTWRGVIATVATSGAVVFSTLEKVKAWLQIGSLVMSLVIGALTIVTLVRNLRRKKRD